MLQEHYDIYQFIYDFEITKDYDVLEVSRELGYEDADKYTEKIENKITLHLDKVVDELKKEEHQKRFTLNTTQKRILKKCIKQ